MAVVHEEEVSAMCGSRVIFLSWKPNSGVGGNLIDIRIILGQDGADIDRFNGGSSS